MIYDILTIRKLTIMFQLEQKYMSVNKQQLYLVILLQDAYTSVTWQICKSLKKIEDTRWMKFKIISKCRGFQIAHPIRIKSIYSLYWYTVAWGIWGHPIMGHMRVTLRHEYIKIWSIQSRPFLANRIARSMQCRLVAYVYINTYIVYIKIFL
jgi:hypothetical protein